MKKIYANIIVLVISGLLFSVAFGEIYYSNMEIGNTPSIQSTPYCNNINEVKNFIGYYNNNSKSYVVGMDNYFSDNVTQYVDYLMNNTTFKESPFLCSVTLTNNQAIKEYENEPDNMSLYVFHNYAVLSVFSSDLNSIMNNIQYYDGILIGSEYSGNLINILNTEHNDVEKLQNEMQYMIR